MALFFCNATVFCSSLYYTKEEEQYLDKRLEKLDVRERERLFLGSSYAHKKWLLLHPVYMACPTNATP